MSPCLDRSCFVSRLFATWPPPLSHCSMSIFRPWVVVPDAKKEISCSQVSCRCGWSEAVLTSTVPAHDDDFADDTTATCKECVKLRAARSYATVTRLDCSYKERETMEAFKVEGKVDFYMIQLPIDEV